MTERKRILVVDDDVELRELLQFYLAKLGHEVATAVDGKQGLAALERGSFDLVLLDVMIPELDGYHVAHNVTERLGPNAPKILLMTSRDVSKERGIAVMSGSDAVLQKPFKLADLKAKIAALFQ